MTFEPEDLPHGSFDFESEEDKAKAEAKAKAEETKLAAHLSPNDPRWNAINQRRMTQALEDIVSELREQNRIGRWQFMAYMTREELTSKEILEYMEQDAKDS